ncbi:hypothetical protein O181_109343 [Austropuccinia psidii MF-1]|uniref:Uncharacterized protein n=1 Tax=Austropuccinia psidii MF-1 TaxID=1389203 RepID=A0A9Q3PPR4_9BASI|nr:hypothetical protein [Austropuccinia psidii MF-1]
MLVVFNSFLFLKSCLSNIHLLQDIPDLRPELKQFSLHLPPAVPQLRAELDRGPSMEGATPSRKEGSGPRISSSFSRVVGRFPGLSRTSLKVPGEDD